MVLNLLLVQLVVEVPRRRHERYIPPVSQQSLLPQEHISDLLGVLDVFALNLNSLNQLLVGEYPNITSFIDVLELSLLLLDVLQIGRQVFLDLLCLLRDVILEPLVAFVVLLRDLNLFVFIEIGFFPEVQLGVLLGQLMVLMVAALMLLVLLVHVRVLDVLLYFHLGLEEMDAHLAGRCLHRCIR